MSNASEPVDVTTIPDISTIITDDGFIDFAKYKASENKVYSIGNIDKIAIQFEEISDAITESLRYRTGRGIVKKAYSIIIRSGDATGQPAVLLIPIQHIGARNGEINVEQIFNNQLIAYNLGYAPKPYTYITSHRGAIVSEPVKGVTLHTMNGDLTVEQQLALLKAILELHTEHIYQEDTNSKNYYFDGNNVYIIDDLTTANTYDIIKVMDILSTIQNLSNKGVDIPLRKFAKNILRYFRNSDYTLLGNDYKNKRTGPLPTLSNEQKTNIGEDFYNRAMELIKPYDIAELASTVKEPNTYFKLNGNVYKYIHTVDNGLFCKRLGEDRRWSTDETRIEMDSLGDIPINGIFGCNVQAGGGQQTTRRTRRLRPMRRKNVRKSVRRKHA